MPKASGIHFVQRANSFETVCEVASAPAGEGELVHSDRPQFENVDFGIRAVPFKLYGTEASGCASSYDCGFQGWVIL